MNDTSEDHPLLAPLATIPAAQRSRTDADWFPAVDIMEDAGEYLFKIDLPDVNPGNLHVFVEQDGLFVSGERGTPPVEHKKSLRIERPQGYFERRFALPDDANKAAINSTFQNGVLELHVPKAGAAPPNPPVGDTRPKLRLCSAA
jgi:HSP20 family protein